MAELIGGKVSVAQCRKAVTALTKHAERIQKEQDANDLLGPQEQNVWLVVAVKNVNPRKKIKPFRIPISHPIVDPRVSSICLITKDPQREYKDLLESHGIKFISRVVGVQKLKGKFKSFEARRLLLQENAMFMADDRVIPLLPGLLGSKFFQAKKQPIPVCLTRKDLKGELERAVSSSYMHQNQGTCTSIKIATLSHSVDQIQSNLRSAIPAVAKHIMGGWDNLQSLHIKTNSSASLPIWSCELGNSEGGRWSSAVTHADKTEWGGFGDTPAKAAEPLPQKTATDRAESRSTDGPHHSDPSVQKPAKRKLQDTPDLASAVTSHEGLSKKKKGKSLSSDSPIIRPPSVEPSSEVQKRGQESSSTTSGTVLSSKPTKTKGEVRMSRQSVDQALLDYPASPKSHKDKHNNSNGATNAVSKITEPALGKSVHFAEKALKKRTLGSKGVERKKEKVVKSKSKSKSPKVSILGRQ